MSENSVYFVSHRRVVETIVKVRAPDMESALAKSQSWTDDLEEAEGVVVNAYIHHVVSEDGSEEVYPNG